MSMRKGGPQYIPTDEAERRDALPWCGPWPWSPRCKARTGTGARCELAPHRPENPDSPANLHALERGMDTPRWSTEWIAVPG